MFWKDYLFFFQQETKAYGTEHVSWNLNSINNSSVEHLKYIKIAGLIRAMEEAYAELLTNLTFESMHSVLLHNISMEKPHTCKCSMTAHS